MILRIALIWSVQLYSRIKRPVHFVRGVINFNAKIGYLSLASSFSTTSTGNGT